MSGLDDLTGAILSVTGTLTTYRVPYFVTGSLASSMHAVFRATNDVDIVADFRLVDLRVLMSAFDAEFFADPEQAVAAVSQGLSFNLIHRTSYLKVDFFPAVSAFNRAALKRSERVVLVPDQPAIQVATREDILLAKLWWYRLDDESSEQQRRDILGIIALNRELIDHTYLDRWSADLGVHDLLDRFLALPGHP